MVFERGFFAPLAIALLAAVASPLGPLAPSVASAQTEAEEKQPSAADKETARSLMDVGVDREEAKDFAAALKAYQGAHALVRLPMTGVAVARMQAELGQLVEALNTAAEVTQLPHHPNEGAAYAKARADAEALTEKVFARTPSIQVTVTFASGAAKDGVEVSIDGVVLPSAAASLPRKVNPGKHTVVAAAQGYETVTREIKVPEGAVTPVSITLTPGGGSSTPGTGPGPIGDKSGPTGPENPPVDGGSGGLSPLVYVGFGVGAAGLIAGSITGGISLSKTSDLRDQCHDAPCPPGLQPEIDKANTMANVSNVSFGLGVAGVAAGVIGLLLPRGPRQEKPAATGLIRVTPVVGLGGVAISGTF